MRLMRNNKLLKYNAGIAKHGSDFFTAHITGDLMIFTEDNEYVLLHLQMTH